jgi:Abortive infection C-terminus
VAYQLQRLRELIERHPERAGSLMLHIEALEQSIERLPLTSLSHVRTMFEAAHGSVAGPLKIVFGEKDSFPQKNRAIIKALDLALDGHPDAEKIEKQLKALLGSMNGAAAALAELSNISGMRHGGALDLPTLERQHAYMLGGLCDALVSFLLDTAWSRPNEQARAPLGPFYDDEPDFNESLDSEYGLVEIAGSVFTPSTALFRLDPTQYEAARDEWRLASDDLIEDSEAA